MKGLQVWTKLLFLVLATAAAAFLLDKCSTTNVAGGSGTYFEFNSNGKCHDTCNEYGYSVAIVQEFNCWCANEAPGLTVSTSKCNDPCPGFPDEKCANSGYYGYIYINGEPSQTAGDNSELTSSPLTQQETTPNTPSETSSPETTSTKRPKTTDSSSTSTSSTSSSADTETAADTDTSETTSSPDQESSHSARPTTVYSIKTVKGDHTTTVFTKWTTVSSLETGDSSSDIEHTSASSASSATSHAASSTAASQHKTFFDSKGKVAGTFTAVGIVVLGLVAGLLYCCCCGSHGNDNDSFDEENQWSSDENSTSNEKAAAFAAAGGAAGVSKQLSMNSTLPLKRDNSSHSIRLLLNLPQTGGILARKLTKKKAAPRSRLELNASIAGNPVPGGLMFPITEFDSRLDPHAMFMAQNESKNTLGDENDYSRRILTVTNPE